MNPTASTSPSSRTWRIGLTGGIGSGKSTVAGMLRELGAAVIDADAISRGLTAAGGAALPEIARQFGTHMIGADGALDRSAMRQLVFADPAARQRLEAIIHPLVGQQTAERAQAALAQGCRVLVHDVPLLVEAGERWRRQLDRVWVVDCEEATQRERVMARSGLSAAEVQAIIDQQARRQQRLACADGVIRNEGLDLAALREQVQQAWQHMTYH
ncbi:MAG: Dephospho-CoA kinase [Pseudomonadota bacterium]